MQGIIDLTHKFTRENAGISWRSGAGWYKRFRTDAYYRDFPEIEPAFANRPAESGVGILALDTPSPDRAPYDVHKILLSNDVLIIENLTEVDRLVGISAFQIIALPARFDWDGGPVRVVAHT